jgi:predicted TIM-barrel fold metal-dependent hydrolase
MVGVEKLIWGTDVPGLLTHATYPQLLSYVNRHCQFFSQSDLEKVLGSNALQVYGDI